MADYGAGKGADMTAPALIQENRQQWLLERQGYLGGTDIAAIVGKHKFMTPLSVYSEKALGLMADDADQKVVAMMGLALEPVVRGVVERDFKCETKPGRLVMHPEYSFLGVNPDGWMNDDLLVEFKTHGFVTRDEWGEEMSDEVPDAYHVQATWQCGITGAKQCLIAAFDRDRGKCRYYMVEANPAYFEALVTIGVRFWNQHVLAKVEPLVSSDRDLPIVREIYKKADLDAIISTDVEDEIAAEFIACKGVESEASKKIDLLKARMIQIIGNHEGIKTAYGSFTYKPRKDGVRVFLAPRAAKEL